MEYEFLKNSYYVRNEIKLSTHTLANISTNDFLLIFPQWQSERK